MVTYCLETDTRQVAGYARRLSDAKELAAQQPNKVTILALQGPYPYEGFHKYRLAFKNKKWRKVPV